MPERDLPQELRALRADAEWPPTPDLVAAVLARLPATTPRPALRRGRALAPRPRRLAAAILAALLLLPAAALALPGPRHAILETLGLRHVTVERRPGAPPAAVTRDQHLGERTTLAAAARAAGFTPRLPTRLGAPDRVYVRDDIITVLYTRPELLLAEARGRLERNSLHKVIAVNDTARAVTVGGAPGVFLADPHGYQWFDATGPLVRSGPALVWERAGLVLRLEGERSQRRATALARSVR
jgi:hypothetical protein